MHSLPRWQRHLASFAVLACAAAPLTAQCALQWTPGPSAAGPNSRVSTLRYLANGDLLASGTFVVADDQLVNRVARWDGSHWLPLGGGTNGTVRATAVLPNGDIVVGGTFTSAGGVAATNVARWNGTSWSALGGGLAWSVTAMAVASNGDVLAAVQSGNIGAPPGPGVARWNGVAWSPLGPGTPLDPAAIAVLPSGNVALAATFAGGAAAGIWNGASWAPIVGMQGVALSFAVLPSGDLVIGGTFTLPANAGVLVWDGFTLQVPGGSAPNFVRTVLAEPNGGIVAGGDFTAMPGGAATHIARWDGNVWSALGAGRPAPVQALALSPGGLLVAGCDTSSGLQDVANPVAAWNGTSWTTIGNGAEPPQVYQFAPAPNGDMVIGGVFASVQGVTARNVARWNGSAWTNLGPGVDGTVTAVTVAGNGDVIVGGEFTAVGGSPANRVARWDGTTWSTLGTGLLAAPTCLLATASGQIIAAGGTGLLAAPGAIVRWNGATWSPLGSPAITMSPSTIVHALAELPNGDVVAAGSGMLIGGTTAVRIARFSGATWTPMGSPSPTGSPFALAVMADGTLVAGGLLPSLGHLIEWNGSAWVPFRGGGTSLLVNSLAPMPNGQLAVGGYFTLIGNTIVSANGLAKWDGVAWSQIAGGIGTVTGMGVSGRGEVFAAGPHVIAGGHVSAKLARAAPGCPAAVTQLGLGCAGSAGAVTLTAQNLPFAGGVFRAEAHGMPTLGLAVHVVGASAVTLPLPSAGCFLFASPDITGLLLPNGNRVAAPIALPPGAALVGQAVYQQVVALELDATLALVGITSTNALRLLIGGL